MLWLKILLIAVLVVVVLCLIASEVMYHMTFKRYNGTPYTTVKLYNDYKENYPRELITFPSGKYNLQGYIYGAGNTRGLVVFTHGIFSFHEEYLSIMLHMVDEGFQVFAFDIKGCGRSEGKNCRSMTQSVMDLHAALTFIESQERFRGLKVITMGHSWGGFASAAVLNFSHKIAATVALSGYNESYNVMKETMLRMNKAVGILLPVAKYELELRYGRKQAHLTAVNGINKAAEQGTAVLITHGDHDEMIAYDGASIISHKNEITNPKVTYYTFTKQGLNMHNSFFNTARAQNYYVQTFREFQEIEKKYKRKRVPEDVRKAFYESKDKNIANELSTELTQVIDAFLKNEGI
ncbi:MAG: lysophospholipase [Lachnospiraceae bacterium]|nr:lysophospholipase [Lachnospiraceae bacterium]